MNTSSSAPPRIPWIQFGVVLIGTFLGPMGGVIVAVSQPWIAEDFDTDLQSVKWILLTYLMVTTFLLPVIGRLGHRIGEARLFTWGFIVDATGTLICGLVPESSIWFLSLGRIVQAIGSVMIFALFSALVTKIVPQEKRGMGFGFAGATVAISLVISPVLAVVLCSNFDWRWVFFIQVPLQILGFILALRNLDQKPSEATGKESFPIASLACWVGLVSAMLLITETFSRPVIATYLPVLIGVAVVSLAGLVLLERKPDSLFELSLFREKAFWMGSAGLLTLNMCIFVMTMFIPFFLEDYMKLSPARMGGILSISPIVTLFFAPLAGRMADRNGYKLPALLGIVLSAASYALIAMSMKSESIGMLGLALALLGAGGGLYNAPALSAMMSSAGDALRPRASSTSSLMRNLGFLFGTSVGAMVFTIALGMLPGGSDYAAASINEQLPVAVPKAAFLHAAGTAFWFCTGATVLLLLVSLRFPNRLNLSSASKQAN